MTKEEKAREIIRQNGKCDGVGCNYGDDNQCPCYEQCSNTNGTNEAHPDKVSACRLIVGSSQPPQPSKTLLDEFAMAAIEGICANVPLEQFAQDVLDKKYDNDAQAEAYAYVAMKYARAMMKERARRDEMGNVKEVE